jgi:hypothetical protein
MTCVDPNVGFGVDVPAIVIIIVVASVEGGFGVMVV